MKILTALLFIIYSSTAKSENLFAEIDNSNIILRVIVVDQTFIDTGKIGNPNNYIQTYYDGSQRKNYAGIGYTFDNGRNAFIPEKPFPSWTLDETKAQWKAPHDPVPGQACSWSEPAQKWLPVGRCEP